MGTIMGVSDASILASEVDMALLVIQYRKYPQVMTVRAKQMVEKVGGNLLGVVLNNISVYNKGPQLILRKNGSDPDTAGNLSDHNLLLAVGGIVAKNGWAGETAFSVAEWQRVSNQDTHSREGDPRFAMPTMGDFRLLEGSPALGAGQVLSGVKDDFFGRARPKGHVSMGAAEKSSLDYPRPPLW